MPRKLPRRRQFLYRFSEVLRRDDGVPPVDRLSLVSGDLHGHRSSRRTALLDLMHQEFGGGPDAEDPFDAPGERVTVRECIRRGCNFGGYPT